MIEVRRSTREIIRADPISEKQRTEAWLRYIKATGADAIREAMAEKGKNDERAM